MVCPGSIFVLNLKIAMSTMMILSRLVFLLGLVLSSSQASTEPVITIPGEGEVVEGIVEIHGSIPADNFVSAKLAYAYSGKNVEDWFIIANIDSPKQDDVLGVWDTTTITDGTYQIRLRVKTTSGEKMDAILTGIQVANYTKSGGAIEDTGAIAPFESSTQVPIESIAPTPTSLPANPATITSEDLRRTAVTGSLIGIGLVFFVLVWSIFHHK